MSIFLAKFLGLYLIIVTLAFLFNRQKIAGFESDLATHPFFSMILGSLGVMIGLLITLSHNVWMYDWPVVITLLGWLILIKGFLRLFFPEETERFNKKLVDNYPVALQGILVIFFFIGLFLTYKGFQPMV